MLNLNKIELWFMLNLNKLVSGIVISQTLKMSHYAWQLEFPSYLQNLQESPMIWLLTLGHVRTDMSVDIFVQWSSDWNWSIGSCCEVMQQKTTVGDSSWNM